MPDIDPEAAGILIESGVDVPTALVGSIIDEPQSPKAQGLKAGALRAIGLMIGVAAAITYLAWRSF